MVRGSSSVLRAFFSIVFAVGPASAVGQGEDRQACITWDQHEEQRLSEGKSRRMGRPPAAFYTGVFVRAIITFKRGPDSVDVMEALRESRVLVGSVICGSPAAATDLREGDEILMVNGRPSHERGVLPSLQYPNQAGVAFRLRVRRDRQTKTITLRSVRRPLETGGPGGG